MLKSMAAEAVKQHKQIRTTIRDLTLQALQMRELSAHAREVQAAMRSSREAGFKVMHALTQNYATLVSGVLIGLSEALEHGKPKNNR
jgi:predicted ABC-type sugar transport system permease subunit